MVRLLFRQLVTYSFLFWIQVVKEWVEVRNLPQGRL